jgi:hypothetical protein
MNFDKNKIIPLSLGTACLSVAAGWTIFAWSEPGTVPPAGGVSAPINVGATAQTKSGDLTIGNTNWTQLAFHPQKDDVFNPFAAGANDRAHFHFSFPSTPSGKKALLEIPADLWVNSSSLKVDGDTLIDGNVRGAAFYYTSDASLKKDISGIENGLDKVTALDGVYFKWKDGGAASMGLIAQDVEKIFPEAVSANPGNGLKSVDYGKLVAPLIEAIKEQQREIAGLKTQISELQVKINAAAK